MLDLPAPAGVPPSRFWSLRHIAYLSAIAFILGVYIYPALRTASTTGFQRLPAVAAPDLGLYLSLSRLETDGHGTVVDPYYRLQVPSDAVGFLKFRLGPALYGLVTILLGGRMWPALFVWNLFWWGLLCLTAIWLFDRFLPRAPLELVLAGLALLMLVDIGTAQRLLAAWLDLPSLAGFESIRITYIRPFSPQIAVPLLLGYVGLQIVALRKRSYAAWGAMALVQFFACAAFPYATVMMAGTTAVAVSWWILARAHKSALRVVLGYGLLCAAVDLTFLLHGSTGFRTGSPDQSSLIHIQLSLLPLMIGKLWVLTGILVVATAVTSKLAPDVKWTLIGLGITNMAFLLADAVVPETTLMLSDHAGYFVHSTIVVLSIFLISAHLPSAGSGYRVACAGLLVVVGLCSLHGLFLAEANYRRSLPANREQADMGRWLARGAVAHNDLVISQYDACAWVPLLSDAETLFCRNAQCMLTPEQNRQVQRLREVQYLYFEGKDRRWISETNELGKYGFYYETFQKGVGHDQSHVSSRDEMLRLYGRVEQGDPATTEFFHRFRRIWIVQNAEKPTFVDTRLGTYLQFGEREQVGSLSITAATAKRE